MYAEYLLSLCFLRAAAIRAARDTVYPEGLCSLPAPKRTQLRPIETHAYRSQYRTFVVKHGWGACNSKSRQVCVLKSKKLQRECTYLSQCH
jgi:hypothetical protein